MGHQLGGWNLKTLRPHPPRPLPPPRVMTLTQDHLFFHPKLIVTPRSLHDRPIHITAASPYTLPMLFSFLHRITVIL